MGKIFITNKNGRRKRKGFYISGDLYDVKIVGKAISFSSF